MNLYDDDNAKDFSDTRNHPWAGWDKALEKIQFQDDSISVLDLGCGNARFLRYLNNKFPDKLIKYTGIDYSDTLLTIAQDQVNKNNQTKTVSNFINQDLENIDWNKEITEKYELAVGFGVLHHITTFEKRLNLLKTVSAMLKENGNLVVTFWQFAENKDFLKKHIVEDLTQTGREIREDKYADDNYILSFGNNGATRFCHNFSEEEIDELSIELGVNEISRFSSDGFGNKMNRYVVWGK